MLPAGVSSLGSTQIDLTPVGARLAARIELAEARAWADLYAAAPPAFAASAGLGARWLHGALVLEWAASGRRYFSRAIGFGVTRPATEQALDRLLALYREASIDMFLVQSLPHCRPGGYEELLRRRGLEPFDRQDRIVRGGEPPAQGALGASGRRLAVERVESEGADEWSQFLQRTYGLDTGPWLPRLIGRPGWHQYVAREDGRVVAARAMHIGRDGVAWLGMDGPVPGLGTQDYEPDAAICARIVQDGLALGARSFIADIEAPSLELDTPAYRHFAALGFARPYVRTHYARVSR
jgi:hypothetical protein